MEDRADSVSEPSLELLRNLPSRWQALRLRRLIMSAINGTTAEQLDLRESDSVAVTRIESISRGKINWDRLGWVRASALLGRYKMLPGDVLFSHINSLSMVGNVAYYEHDRDLYVGVNLLRLRPQKGVCAKFLFWMLKSSFFRQQVESYAKPAINQASINTGTLAALICPVPPVSDQQRIADFLDRETAEADALIAKYERLIELLEEKRVALITQAVTKGLDPTVPMKDSGVEWIGRIPARWEVGPIRRYYSVVDCKHVTVDFEDEGIPVVSVREVKSLNVTLDTANRTSEQWFNVMIGGGRLPRRGDVIFCRNVSPGTCSYVDSDERFAMGQDVCLIRSRKADAKYFNYVMRSNLMKTQIGLVLIGSTFNRINVSTIESLLLPEPGLEEQMVIASWLDDRLCSLDFQSKKVRSAIRLVHEHRAALITAAVTGQVNINSYRSKDQPIEVPA